MLRLKLGYNPSSSSVGSLVFGLPLLLLGGTVLLGAATGALATAWLHGAVPHGRREGEAEGAGTEGTGEGAPGNAPANPIPAE